MPEYNECCLDSDIVTDAMLTYLAFGSWCCCFGSCHFGTWLLVLHSGLPKQSPLQGRLYIEASVPTARMALHRRVISSRMLGLPSQIYFSHSWKMYLLESTRVHTTLNAKSLHSEFIVINSALYNFIFCSWLSHIFNIPSHTYSPDFFLYKSENSSRFLEHSILLNGSHFIPDL